MRIVYFICRFLNLEYSQQYKILYPMGNSSCQNCLIYLEQPQLEIDAQIVRTNQGGNREQRIGELRRNQQSIPCENKIEATQQSSNQICVSEEQKDQPYLNSQKDTKENSIQEKTCREKRNQLKEYQKLIEKYGQNSKQAANIRQKMGRIYYKEGNYVKALEQYIASLKIKQTLKGKGCYQSASTFNNIGLIYAHQGDEAKALQYYTLALKIYEKIKGMGCLQSAVTLHNIATVFNNQANYIKALQYYQEALETYEYFGVKTQRYVDTLQSIGNTYFHLKNYQSAIKSYECSILVLQKSNNKSKRLKVIASKLLKCLRMLEKNEKVSQIETKYGIKLLSSV